MKAVSNAITNAVKWINLSFKTKEAPHKPPGPPD